MNTVNNKWFKLYIRYLNYTNYITVHPELCNFSVFRKNPINRYKTSDFFSQHYINRIMDKLNIFGTKFKIFRDTYRQIGYPGRPENRVHKLLKCFQSQSLLLG